MKPNHPKLFTLLIIGVLLSVGFVACKKDKITEPLTNDEKQEIYDSKTNQIVQRIKRFDNQLKEIKQGTYRGDNYINADSAIWNIEALFNTTYSFPDKKFVEKKVHELSFEIDVNNDMLSMKDVNELYDSKRRIS